VRLENTGGLKSGSGSHWRELRLGVWRVLISPGGEIVLFNVGKEMKRKDCTKVVSYLDGLQIKKVDYWFVSATIIFDHIGCVPDALEQFPLQHEAYDRGESYPGGSFTA